MGMVSMREGQELKNYQEYRDGDITLETLKQRIEDSKLYGIH
jgi:hypothetical protein